MKHFTMQWWNDVQTTGPSDPSQGYLDYIESIKDKISKSALSLAKNAPLHDCSLNSLSHDVDEASITISLTGDDGNGGARTIFLTYEGVTKLSQTTHDDLGLPGPPGIGDLGYHEISITDSGDLQHNILFSSATEIEITCTDVQFSIA